MKRHLVDALSNRSAFIRGHIQVSDLAQKECQFKIFEDMIKICHCQSELNYTFNYCAYEPRFEIVARDATKLWIVFNNSMGNSPDPFLRALFGQSYEGGRQECRMEVKFANKFMKDIFQLTLKAFSTKKQLANSVAVHKIEESSFNENQDLNLLMEIESLRTDVMKLTLSNQQKEQ